MIKFTLILIGTVGVLAIMVPVSSAINENMTIEEIYEMAQNIVNATDKWQTELKDYPIDGRKSKLLPFGGLLPFHALWGFGGLNALGILFAIKIKIIIIAGIIAIGAYYYLKVVHAKKICNNDDVYREGAVYPMETSHHPTYFSSPITSYSSHIGDIPSYTGYSNYPGIDPYSGYHDSHSDIGYLDSDIHHHHQHHDYNHYPDSSHFHSDPSSHEFSSPPETPPSNPDNSKESTPINSGSYRRVSKHRKRRSPRQQQQIDFLDFGEVAFRFLGVDTMGCRKRFVCELDFRAKANPITRLAFSFIGRNFFERYRLLDENIAPPKTFADCAKIFTDCKDAERFDGNDEEEEQNEHDIHEEHEDEQEGAGDSWMPTENETTIEFTTDTNDVENKIVQHKRFNDFAPLL